MLLNEVIGVQLYPINNNECASIEPPACSKKVSIAIKLHSASKTASMELFQNVIELYVCVSFC